MLLILRHLGGWDQDAILARFSRCKSLLPVHTHIHLGVHDLKARHCVEHVKIGLAKHLASAQVVETVKDLLCDILELIIRGHRFS